MMFPLLATPEGVIPIVGIAATSNGQTRDLHRFGCGNELFWLGRHVVAAYCCDSGIWD